MIKKSILPLAVFACTVLGFTAVKAGSVVNSVPFVNLQFTDDAATAPVFDITELGSIDWALYGARTDPLYSFGEDNQPTPFAPDYSKAGGTAIGDAMNLVIADNSPGSGFTTAIRFANDGNQPQPGAGFEGAIEYSWTDGEAPNTTGQSPAVLTVFGDDDAQDEEKIVIEVAASTAAQRLWVFPQSKHGGVSLMAEIDDGNTTPLVLTDLFDISAGNSVDDDANGYLALDFSADTPGSTLTLTLTQGTRYFEGIVNNAFGIGAVAVGEVPEPSSVVLFGISATVLAFGVRYRNRYAPRR